MENDFADMKEAHTRELQAHTPALCVCTAVYALVCGCMLAGTGLEAPAPVPHRTSVQTSVRTGFILAETQYWACFGSGLRLQPEPCPFKSLKCLDPGSGRKTPAIWYGAGAYAVFF